MVADTRSRRRFRMARALHTGPVESMGTAATSALVTKLLKTKKVQGALAAAAVEVVSAAADLLGGDVVERVDGPPTDVLFDVATR